MGSYLVWPIDSPPQGLSQDLLDLATEVFGAAARDWLRKPHPLFDGQTPAAFAVEHGPERVRSTLNAIRDGGVA